MFSFEIFVQKRDPGPLTEQCWGDEGCGGGGGGGVKGRILLSHQKFRQAGKTGDQISFKKISIWRAVESERH